MKQYLRLIRNDELIKFWEDCRGEFTVAEIGEIFGLKATGAWQIISEYEKNKDPDRHIEKFIKRSDKELRAKKHGE